MTDADLDAPIHPSRSSPARLDVIGATLFVALAAWIVVAAAVAGGNPWPMASLVLGTGVMVFAARQLTRMYGPVLPGAAVTVLLVVVAVMWREATHPHFGLLGYSNANGALYAIGVGAACLVMLRTRWPGNRIAAGLAAVVLAALPWIFNAAAAAASGLVILAATAVLLITGRRSRWLVHVAVVGAVISLVGTVLAGLLYAGDGEGTGGWRLTERRFVLWRDAIDMVRASPLVGQGPGRFAEFSPTARADRDASWAHHEPLTLAAETGLPGMLLLLAIVVWAFVWLSRGSGRRGATLASVVLAVAFTHATIDFVWHNPAVPLLLAVVVGAGVTAGPSASRSGEISGS